jgi:protein TonB
MRALFVLAAFLLLSLGLIAQNSDPASSASPPSSTSPPAQEKSDSIKPPGTVVIHDGVTKGVMVHMVRPKYPKAARKAHIEGTVVMRAEIGKDGRIQDLEAVSGPPELVPAAMEAVRKWRYRPYLLYNEPVVVDTEIRVNFALTQ